LLEFDGSAIVVSHDRYFLNRVVDILLVLEGDGNVQVIYGNYDTYLRMQAVRNEGARADRAAQKDAPAKPVDKSSDDPPGKKSKRKRRFPYRKLEDLEADIAGAETRLRQLEQQLASSELYREGDKVKETMKAFEDTKAALKQLYEHWEEAGELN
jgi:ATP-binding cassette subfamily F protein 3